MQVKAIIFDLYGVLGLNGWQAFKQKHFARRPEAWEHLRALGQRVDEGKASDTQLVAAVAKASGETGQLVRYQFEHTIPNVSLLKYIAEDLRADYKIGLLSNASRDVLGDIFSPVQLELFDVAISSFHVGLTKPDPRMFILISEQLDVLPEECLFVDDQERHIEAARALGFNTVLYKSVTQVKRAIQEALTS
jgi:putative hydrolase of the HAD superfamily